MCAGRAQHPPDLLLHVLLLVLGTRLLLRQLPVLLLHLIQLLLLLLRHGGRSGQRLQRRWHRPARQGRGRLARWRRRPRQLAG